MGGEGREEEKGWKEGGVETVQGWLAPREGKKLPVK